MTHRNRARLSKLSLALVAALAAAPVFAQSTSAGVVGHVVGADGQPVAGAEVTITHVESGTVSRAVTDANGNYASRGLRVGGPYTITVNKAGAGTSTQQNVFLQLNQVADIDSTLSPSVTTLGGVQVVASAVDIFSSENKGVGTSVSGRQLETAVNGERSLDGIARLDPRITVIDQNDGSISVAGQNNRYNNISVDSLSQTDPFGLNANGLGYSGSPISPDVIAAYDLKVTDYDVTSDTVGANINAVVRRDVQPDFRLVNGGAVGVDELLVAGLELGAEVLGPVAEQLERVVVGLAGDVVPVARQHHGVVLHA